MTERRLPITVPLVRAETITSYLARLAAANHLPVQDLRTHLGMAPSNRTDLTRLAELTGHPTERLADVLIGTGPAPGRTRMSPLPRARPACRQCMASHGIYTLVEQVQPAVRVCLRQRRWLGAATNPPRRQYDVTPLPAVMAAQRKHTRLIRRYGFHLGHDAIYWAGQVVERWAELGLWPEQRTQLLADWLETADPGRDAAAELMPLVSYPQTVTLAGLLADPYWQTVASADHPRDRLTFDLEATRRLQIPFWTRAPDDPLVTWQEGLALVRRMHQARGQPGPNTPEVWLSRAGEPPWIPSDVLNLIDGHLVRR